MFYKLKDFLNRAWFTAQCSGVFKTPPATVHADSNLAVFTQLQHKDVLQATLAFKSFARQIPVGSFYVLDDGSLTPEDLKLLRNHLPGVTFFALADFSSSKCPRGGTWERLLAIAELSLDRYVIQLDSDTLTLGPLPEITAAVQGNVSFAIGTWDRQQFEPMTARQEQAARMLKDQAQPQHVQLLAEANFDKLHDFSQCKYVRGCSGFSGFGKHSVSRAFIERISSEMFAALGDKWAEWGSEQVMSNIVVANSESAVVLPHPKYCDCTKIKAGETAFIHFIGTCRFSRNTYARYARRFLKDASFAP